MDLDPKRVVCMMPRLDVWKPCFHGTRYASLLWFGRVCRVTHPAAWHRSIVKVSFEVYVPLSIVTCIRKEFRLPVDLFSHRTTSKHGGTNEPRQLRSCESQYLNRKSRIVPAPRWSQKLNSNTPIFSLKTLSHSCEEEVMRRLHLSAWDRSPPR